MQRPDSSGGEKPYSGAPAPRRNLAPVAGLGSQFDLRQALIILRSHFLVAAAIAVVVCTLIGWYQMRKPRVYASTSTLALERRERVLDMRQSDMTYDEPKLATRIGELRSAEVVDRVVGTLSEEERRKVTAPYAEDEAAARGSKFLANVVRRSVSVDRQPGTLLASITVSHRDADVAALLANRFAEQYIVYLFDKSSASSNASLSFLRDQAEDLRKKLEASERSLQEYRSRYNLVSLEESQNIVVDRLKSLNASATAARVRRSELDVRLKQAQQALEQHGNPVELASLAEFGALSDVQKNIDDLTARRAVLAERYGRRHPVMQENARTLEALGKLRDDQIVAAIANLKARRDKAEAEEHELSRQLSDSETEALRLDRIGVEYNVLRRAIDTQKSIYTQILSRLNEASISAQLESVNVRIADRAQANPVPISPNIRKISLVLAFLAGAILLGYPFGVELLFARVRSGSDVEYHLDSTLLGEISAVGRIAESDRPRLVERDVDEASAEQFRALFSQLQLVSRIDPPKTILVTSTVPSEGKSFIASNLAASFVAHGRRVLLIDADLRRPSLHRSYGLDNKAGLLRWLESGGTVGNDIEKDEHLGLVEITKNLFLLRTGGNTRHASELVGAGRFAELVAALQRRFDVVIFDTPPAGVFPDAISFAGMCNELIFVCRFGKVPRQQVRGVLDRLRQTGLEFPGIVLNAMPSGRGSGHYYYYSYGSTGRYAEHYSEKPKKKG